MAHSFFNGGGWGRGEGGPVVYDKSQITPPPQKKKKKKKKRKEKKRKAKERKRERKNKK